MSIKISTPQIIHFNNISLSVKKILARIGYPHELSEFQGEVRLIFDEMLNKAVPLIQAKGTYNILQISSCNKTKVTFKKSEFVIQSAGVAKLLSKTKLAAFFVVTIGPQIELAVKSLIEQGDLTKGFILDTIGSQTADSIANKMHKGVIKEYAGKYRYNITRRFSPGYGDWSITIQDDMLKLCNGSMIGISVNERSAMVPEKSVSAVLGLT